MRGTPILEATGVRESHLGGPSDICKWAEKARAAATSDAWGWQTQPLS